MAVALSVHATYSSTPPVAFQLSRSTAITCMVDDSTALYHTVWMYFYCSLLISAVPHAVCSGTLGCRNILHLLVQWPTFRLRFLASLSR